MNERDGSVPDRAHALVARKAVRTSGLCALFLLGLLAANTAYADGPVIGWGSDLYGQTSTPVSVGPGAASAIAAGASHSCAIQTGAEKVV